VLGLEPNLRMSEAEARESGSGVRLASYSILGLLSGRAVVPEPIRLDDEPEIGAG
jgi:hypothetical protein